MSKDLFSFMKGWSQVPNGDIPQCREKIMSALKIKTRAAFLNRMKGEIEPKVSEARAIENVFAEYGIKDIWGIE